MESTYRVDLAPRARADAEAIYNALVQGSRVSAQKWLRGFSAKARSLRTNPFLYEIAPDTEELGLPR